MLTADLVRFTRRKGQLFVRPLQSKAKEDATRIANDFIEVFTDGDGFSREEVETQLDALIREKDNRRVAAGLKKLLMDRSEFASPESLEPKVVRSAVFRAASNARRQSSREVPFDRSAIVAEVAASLGASDGEVEAALYGDLKSAQKLIDFKPIKAIDLVDRYQLAQYQAVLLRASEVIVVAEFADQGAAREFFRRLKFLRLMFELRRQKGNKYSLRLSGPHSLFRSSTKYGLQLALALGYLFEAAQFSLEATVHWGKERETLRFCLESQQLNLGLVDSARLPDEVAQLVQRFKQLESAWRVRRASAILHLPGNDVCIPDLLFTHEDGRRAYFEVMGFWSREAVWRRVDLVNQGLRDRVIFAVSDRLRICDEVMEAETGSRLLVYKGTIPAKKVLSLLEAGH